MIYRTVNSSAIEKIGYDITSGECEIVFHSGGTERKQLSKQQYDAFVNADSIGLHYAQHIKTNKVKIVERVNKMKR